MAKICCLCGKEVGMFDSVPLSAKHNGKRLHECKSCFEKAKGKHISINEDGTARIIEDKETEVRTKCNTCGHIYCYNITDIERNKQLAKSATRSSLAGLGNVLGGSSAAGATYTGNAQNALNQVVDYSKCPKCGSIDIHTLSAEEWEVEKSKQNSANSTSAVSSADELKKFKELLDSGVITQEEFDAKKKQLLGL